MILFSYKGKHIRQSDRKYMHNAVPILLGMLVCMICLAGTTWAWFSANSTTSVQLIQSAEYSVDVDVKELCTEDAISSDATNSDYPAYSTSYSDLEAEKEYIVTLTPDGSAKTGYCIVAVGGKFYYTNVIPEEGLTFTYRTGLPTDNVVSAGDYDEALQSWTGELLIAWYWGEYPNTQGHTTFAMDNILLLSDGDVIGNELTTRPEEKATLSLNLTNMTADKENGDLAVGADCVITLTANEGYTLPDSISVAGVETYTYDNGVLTIPADQVKDGAEITVTAAGVAKPTEEPTELSPSRKNRQ